MAHVKGGGKTKNNRDSQSKRLGVKLFGGQEAKSGDIIIRQRGTKYQPGVGVGTGKDYTIYATQTGYVSFYQKRKSSFTGTKHRKTYVSVVTA